MVPAEQARSSRRWLALLALGAFWITARFAKQVPVLDDAYISFRYARNFVDGLGLVFNPGEVVEGYSNFLWTILSALWIALGLDPVETARDVGLFSALGSALLVFLALFRGRPAAAFWATVSLCLLPIFIRQSENGLETSFFAFLVTLGFVLGERGGGLPAAFAFALAALTRFEGALFFAVYFAGTALAWRRRADRRPADLLAPAAVFLLVFVPYFILRWIHFGQFFPNTYYAKRAGLAHDLYTGAAYLRGLFIEYPLFLLALVRRRKLTEPAFLAFPIYCLYLVWVGGDSFDNFRLVAPAAPLGVLLVFQNTWRFPRPVRWPVAALVVLWSLGKLLTINVPVLGLLEPTARELGRVTRPGQSLATAAIGVVGWENPGLVVIDTLGLTDPAIAHAPADPQIHIKGHQKYDPERVLARNPDYFLPMGRLVEGGAPGGFVFQGMPFDQAIIDHPRFRERYEPRWLEVEGRRFVYFARVR